jgi:hypothetical protein
MSYEHNLKPVTITKTIVKVFAVGNGFHALRPDQTIRLCQLPLSILHPSSNFSMRNTKGGFRGSPGHQGAYSIHRYFYKVIETFPDILIRIGPWNVPCSNASTEAVPGLLCLAATARKCSKAALMKP